MILTADGVLVTTSLLQSFKNRMNAIIDAKDEQVKTDAQGYTDKKVSESTGSNEESPVIWRFITDEQVHALFADIPIPPDTG